MMHPTTTTPNAQWRIPLVLALGLALILTFLWSLAKTSTVALAQGPDGWSTYYVAPSCTGVPAPCFTTIQAAVNAADAPNDVIKIAAGTYTGVQNIPSLNRYGFTATQIVAIAKTVAIRGGYTTTNWAVSDPTNNPTVLDAQGKGRVLYITGNISPTVEGLHITGGDAFGLGGGRSNWVGDGGGVCLINATAVISGNRIFGNTALNGGGLYLSNSPAILSFNVITGNTARKTGVWGTSGGGLFLDFSDAILTGNAVLSNTAESGGGVFLLISNAVLKENTVSSNTAQVGGGLYLGSDSAMLRSNIIISNTAYLGGGLSLGSSNATLDRNVICSNTAQGRGGGLDLWASDATLNGNTICSNTTEHLGGGLFLRDSDATLTNNLVADNRADQGVGGIYIDASSPKLVHTTIAHNSDGGIYVVDDVLGSARIYSDATLTNTILVSQTVGIRVATGNTATLESTLWNGNGLNWNSTDNVNHYHDYFGNPAFVAPDLGNYHLSVDSVAIGKGIDTNVVTDIDGQDRPQGCTPDLGADEYEEVGPPSLTIAKSGPLTATVSTPITYTLTIINHGGIATSLLITDNLPSAAYYVSGGTFMPGGVVSWTMPHMNCGTISVTFAVTATQTITNRDYGVSCAEGVSANGNISVTTQGVNALPVTNAGLPQNVHTSEMVALDGSSSYDPDGHSLTYAWSQTSGISVTLNDPTAAIPTFTAPSAAGTLAFMLIVTDEFGLAGNPDVVIVTVMGDTFLPIILKGWRPPPPPTPLPTPIPTDPPPPADLRITYIEYAPPGDEVQGEYVTIHNYGTTCSYPLNWTLRDNENHVFTFPFPTWPFGVCISPGESLRVWTKAGTTDYDYHQFYWGNNQPIWNNDHDCGYLRDEYGRIVSHYCY